MSRFIEGENRFQSTLFPERMDDYVEQDSVVRMIDVFIDCLDISGLGFKAEVADTGRPSYHARTMLTIYVYGYLNQVHSSRRLEREAKRNVELMWLTGRLAPDFKTIADFRKNNGEAIRLVSREFVMLCRKFKAVNNRDKNFTKAKMKQRIVQVEASIERYLHQLDDADDQALPEDTRPIQEKIAAFESDGEQSVRKASSVVASSTTLLKTMSTNVPRAHVRSIDLRVLRLAGRSGVTGHPRALAVRSNPNVCQVIIDVSVVGNMRRLWSVQKRGSPITRKRCASGEPRWSIRSAR